MHDVGFRPQGTGTVGPWPPKNAVDHLNGFNVCGRYLIVLYYQQQRVQKRLDLKKKEEELAALRAKLNR